MFFSMLTRIMLTSFSNKTYTMLNIVLASGAQGLLRSTIKWRDEWFLKFKSKEVDRESHIEILKVRIKWVELKEHHLS